MLENDGVGQRSGVRPLRAFVVSQKKRNVRRSTSSMVVVGAATARLRGASAEEGQDAPGRMSRAANAADVRRTSDQKFTFRPTCSRRARVATHPRVARVGLAPGPPRLLRGPQFAR